MPISNYPRPGYAIAPKTLSGFLQRCAPHNAGRLCELDASTWQRFDPKTCFALADAVVKEVSRLAYRIEIELRDVPLPKPLAESLRLSMLDLEVRTFNALTAQGIGGFPSDELSVSEVIRFSGFGNTSLIDLLTSLEPWNKVERFRVLPRDFPVVTRDAARLIDGRHTIPAHIRCCVTPPLKPSLELARLNLNDRTYNALERTNLFKNPKRFRRTTIQQLLQIRGFGPDCLVDLLDALFDAQDATCSKAMQNGTVNLCNLSKIVENGALLPTAVLRQRLPIPHGAASLHDLQLRNRTFNVLVKAGYLRSPERLDHLTVEAALRLKSFGIQSLFDLVDRIERFNASSTSVGRNTRKKYAPRDLRSRVDAAQPLPSKLKSLCLPEFPPVQSLQDLGLSLRTFHALEDAGFAATPEKLSGIQLRHLFCIANIGVWAVCEIVQAAYRLLDAPLAKQAVPATFDRAVIDCLIPSRRKRNAEVAARYLGLCGHQVHTLEETGTAVGVTRERVRQIVSKRKHQLRSTILQSPASVVIAEIESTVPCTVRKIESTLREKNLIESETSVSSILRIFELAGQKTKYLHMGAGSSAVIIHEDDERLASKLRLAIRKSVRQHGAVPFNLITEDFPDRLRKRAHTSLCLVIAQSDPGFRLLDDTETWFWIAADSPNRLQKKIRRVLCVAPIISISELRSALRRDLHFPVVPPENILTEFCQQIPECVVDGVNVIQAASELPSDVLRGSELKLVELLLEHGPLCKRRELQRLAVDSKISIPSFWRALNYCQTIQRYARGVYGLTGAEVRPEDVKYLMPAPVRPERVMQDHGWTDDGEIWLAYRISEALLDTGVLPVPTAKRELIAGQFELHGPNGNTIGSLVIKGIKGWGIGPFLRRSSVEVGDILLLTISTAQQRAVVRIGDDGLIDELTE